MNTALPAPEDVRRVVVRMTNWVGDCVMNTPFLARVREVFPKAHVVALGRKNVAALLQHHPHVDEVWTLDDRTRQGRAEAIAKLRAFKPDLGFLLPNSLGSALLFVRGRVAHRVGYARDARRFLLHHPVLLRDEDLAVHEVQYYLRLLSLWQDRPLPPPPLKLHVTEAEREEMAGWLARREIRNSTFVVGVNPAAFFGTAKRWLPQRFAEAARAIANPRDGRVIVTGLPQEREVAQEVCDAGGETFYNAAGEMTLRALMAFLERTNLFLTNDSGAMHIAAALQTPQVAIFGSTDWVTTAPASPQARIVRVETPCAPCLLRHCPIDHRCMTGITAPMVVDAAEELMKNH